MRSSRSLTRSHGCRRVPILAVVLVVITAIVIGTDTLSAQAEVAQQARPDRSSNHHKPQNKHQKNKAQSSSHPCLVGNWDVTSLTLSTTGLTFTGGVGTTVNVMSNGNALGNFTPGTPLTGSEGSAKFNGTITDHYGFSSKTTSRAGTFPVTPVSNMATITVGGVTKPVTSSNEQGSYLCAGKDFTLTFTSGSGKLTYQLAPAG